MSTRTDLPKPAAHDIGQSAGMSERKESALKEPKTFAELVSWACWEVIKGLTTGVPLERIMFGVLQYARRWSPAQATTTPEIDG